jgi:hypothetical protein
MSKTTGIAAARVGGAGQSVLNRMENDPSFRLEMEQARVGLQLTTEILRSDFTEVAEAFSNSLDTLNSFHLSRPETMEEWEHIARVIEMPYDRVQDGNYTWNDVYNWAIAWAEREVIKAKLGSDGRLATAKPPWPAGSEEQKATKPDLPSLEGLDLGKGGKDVIRRLYEHGCLQAKKLAELRGVTSIPNQRTSVLKPLEDRGWIVSTDEGYRITRKFWVDVAKKMEIVID